MTNVIVIVDPDDGDRIETAAQTAPVWTVSSFLNRAACERIWAAHRILDHRQK
jgi:hypothetical protein